MLLVILSILPLWLRMVQGQNPDCDFYQNVKVGKTYYVYSPNYPSNYSAGVQCRWIVSCPKGYNCRLDCSDVDIPPSESCRDDRLLISRSGDPQLAGAESYCGRGTVSAVSIDTSLSVGLISHCNSTEADGLTSHCNSTRGRFGCELRAQKAAPAPAPCSCGYKYRTRIVGGQETTVNEFPMMAGVVDVDIAQIKCGAVIIDKKFLLTAAHCLLNRSPANTAIIVGEHNVTTGDSPATKGYRVSEFIVHPLFTTSNYDYDVAIIKLVGEIKYSNRVGPVCMPFKFAGSTLTGSTVTALGWGTLFPGGPTSDVLRKVDLQVISQQSCRSSVSNLTPRQICTYARGKDACQDDSGGPLLLTDQATGLLFNVGIISYGKSCASTSPGINSRVTSLLDWIVARTPQATYCYK